MITSSRPQPVERSAMKQQRLLFLQHGDYREAALRIAAGGNETYYAQSHSINYVASLIDRGVSVMVMCIAAEHYEEEMPTGVKTIGVPRQADGQIDLPSIRAVIRQMGATHVAMRFPGLREIPACLDMGVRVLPLLADSFNGRRVRDRIRHWRLARVLNHSDIPWVGNHNVNAARSLAAIGVNSNKIVPWDWPSVATPDEYPVKSRPAPKESMQLLYVGSISEPKGVADCIEAVALLRKAGESVELSLIGRGKTEQMQALAESLHVTQWVHFVGAVPHREVMKCMAEQDLVILPSRHEYPEGLPMVMYDAFCSRTPLVASDHPMFAGRAVDGVNAVVFEASNPESLANAIRRLKNDPMLYERISTETARAWQRLQIPVKWADLVDRWLRDNEDDRRWLEAHSLASGRYG